jgi:hypothetical protein
MISALEARPSSPAVLRRLSAIRCSLADVLWQQGPRRHMESLSIISSIISNPDTDADTRISALRRLARLEETQGNLQNAEAAIRKSLDLGDQIWGATGDWRVCGLRLLMGVLEKAKNSEAAEMTSQELEGRLRLMEETAGIGTIEELMRDHDFFGLTDGPGTRKRLAMS